jgi:hypothetical protein
MSCWCCSSLVHNSKNNRNEAIGNPFLRHGQSISTLSPSTDLCSPFDARTCRCNNRTTPGAGPSKAAQKPKKNTLKTPLEPAKKRWSRTPHLCSPNWSGGTVSAQ